MKKTILFCLSLAFCVSLSAQDPALYRQIDGRQNNLANPEWGATHTPLLRIAGNGFADSVSAPAGPGRPNPRYLSNLIFAQEDLLPDPMTLSDFTWVFGQFIDHDLSLTENNDEDISIDVPMGDRHFDPLGFGTVKIPVKRNRFMEGTGTSPSNPRQYPNELTAFLDGSAVYGSDAVRETWLRSHEGGKLKVSAGNLLPYNTIDGELGSQVDPNAPHMGDDVGSNVYLFVAGDVRANENPLLLSFHTVFVREHNRQCDLLAVAHPTWNDEQLYQHARKIVGGVMQSIVYNEWLPTMGIEIPPYSGYNPAVNPQLANTFTAAAFRLGHTLLNSNIRRVDGAGNILPQGNLTLRDAFFNVGAIAEVGGIDPYFAGMAQQTQQSMDSRVIDDVRNFLFGPPGAGGLDLVSINIQRGRERGLPTFNDIRVAYGLPRIMFMGQITPDIPIYSQIFEAYFGDVNRMDPWVAMLAEQEMPGRLFGPTMTAIMRTQFTALRDGDRFFYLNDPVLNDAEIAWIHGTTMRDILMYNTGITLMQDNVFLSTSYEDICGNMTAEVSGQVRVHTSNEVLSAVSVNLLDAGEPTGNTITNATGSYAFPELPACEAVTLSPVYADDSWINGITVQDIITISRHILGFQDITSPYQLLAADADLNGFINVVDIIALRRLILDLTTELPGDLPMWNFIPASYTFTNPLAPWNEAYPTSLNLNSPTMMLTNQDFIAFKRGDINATASINGGENFNGQPAGRSSTPGLIVSADDVTLPAGQPTTVTLRLATEEEGIDYQYSLAVTNAEINAFAAGTLPAEFMNLTQRGNLRFCGEQTAGEALISLTITSHQTARLSEVLLLNQRDLVALAINDDQEVMSVNLDFNVAAPVVVSSQVLRAYPNPFTNFLQLEIPVTVAGPATLALYDVNGRVVMTEKRPALDEGTTTWSLNTNGLPAGQYVYRLVTAAGQQQGMVMRQ